MTPSIAQESIGGAGSTSVSPDLSTPFHKLVADLSQILGPSSGLTSKDVDVQQLRDLMEGYISQEEHWRQYAFADLSRGYTRNLVDEGNGKSNLLVLVWSPRKGSLIHDHADAHCLMKVLHGTLLETRYSIPEPKPESDTPLPPAVIKNTLYTQDEVTYMADDLGLHKISNPDLDAVAVSLHLYTPPNAAREGCNIFDEKTGKKSHVTQSNFYSTFGKKVVA